MTSQTIGNWIKAGALQALRVGHVYRVRREELEAMTARQHGETRGAWKPPRPVGTGEPRLALHAPGRAATFALGRDWHPDRSSGAIPSRSCRTRWGVYAARLERERRVVLARSSCSTASASSCAAKALRLSKLGQGRAATTASSLGAGAKCWTTGRPKHVRYASLPAITESRLLRATALRPGWLPSAFPRKSG